MPNMELYHSPKFRTASYIDMTGSLLADNLLEEDYNLGAWETKNVAFQPPPRYQKSWQRLNLIKENSEAVTQKNTIENEADQTKTIILQIVMSLSAPYKGSLAKRLFELFYDTKEEDPASVGIAIGSLRSFFNFMQAYPYLKCPVITLTPECNIYASWKSSRNKLLSIHFLPGFDVRFVVFAPNSMHANKVIRVSGTATTDVLIKTVKAYGVLNWVCNEG